MFSNQYAEFRNNNPGTSLQIQAHENGVDFEMCRDDDLIKSMNVELNEAEVEDLLNKLGAWLGNRRISK